MYYLLYCLVYLTVWRAVLSTFYTYYLSIHLALKETCMYLVKLVLFVPLFFLILVLSKLFFPIPIVCIVCLVHTNSVTRNFLFVCSPALQPSSAYFSRHILFLSIFLFPFFVFKQSLFSLRRLLYSILLLHTYDMQIML